MENGVFACNIFIFMIFQRRKKRYYGVNGELGFVIAFRIYTIV